MNSNNLQFDVHFDNALFFGQYVMVIRNEKYTGGGLLEKYDQEYVWIRGKKHSRALCSFIQMPPPDVDFPN
ncbi:hypothetical protein [Paenibacillus sp. ATY16]|uniref:hypothetical protein n=1 Tax=Paenibacillus sp. ATY16 TaxID=1759312 RepID=UPI00200F824A|nr:hypothetical protein [Paenibacillus sp. ATY16]MCK9861029.1 hypothetical protein [Paenibacillus sp. ATY16]